jgi:hypothetical protein
VFVDSTKFSEMIMVGTNLKLPGVISQEVFENSDLTLFASIGARNSTSCDSVS